MSQHPRTTDSGQPALPLSFGQFTVSLKAERELPLPRYAGSMFRGAFGRALQHVVCVTRTLDCPPCLLKDRCLYPYVFETPPPADTQVMRKYPAAPHPFVLIPPVGGRTVTPAATFDLGLTVIGRALRWLPHFIFAIERMGRIGLGRGQVQATVTEVCGWREGRSFRLYAPEEGTLAAAETCTQTLALPVRPPSKPGSTAPPERLTIEFLTPLRVKSEEQLATSLDFPLLIRALLRRLAHLSYFHCGGDSSRVAFRDWIALAETVRTVASTLTWYEWTRYSSRQGTTMQLGGLLGHISFEGPLAPFRPFLRAGEVTHVGKATSFGLGQYRLLDDEASQRPR